MAKAVRDDDSREVFFKQVTSVNFLNVPISFNFVFQVIQKILEDFSLGCSIYDHWSIALEYLLNP